MARETLIALGGLGVLAALVASGIHPYDRATWLLEVAPVLIAAPLLALTWRRFPLTTLLYLLICVHALILIEGGAYTYARVPLGHWLQELLGLGRNPYDRIGHFAQGLVPALLAREIFLRGRFVTGRRMAAFLPVCVAMAVSAWYELLEWAAALVLGQGADQFLGTQGDPWDTQADMFTAFLGALIGLALFARLQDRQIARLARARPRLELLVSLWLKGGDVAGFEAFERRAAQRLARHGGRIERALRSAPAHPGADEPFEVHLVSFPDRRAYEAWRADAETRALAPVRDTVIARSEILELREV